MCCISKNNDTAKCSLNIISRLKQMLLCLNSCKHLRVIAYNTGKIHLSIGLHAAVNFIGSILTAYLSRGLENSDIINSAEMTEEQFHKAGRVVLGAAMKRAVEVPYSFYEELQGHMLYYNHEMPMLLLHGEKDNLIPLSYIEPFRQYNPDSKLVVVPGVTDQFPGMGQWDMVVDLTRDWFQYEQVMLCDWI